LFARLRSGFPAAFHKKIGFGDIYIFCAPLYASNKLDDIFLKILEKSIIPKVYEIQPADKLEIVLRENDDGERFLWIVNRDPLNSVRPSISIRGSYNNVADLGILQGIPINTEISVNQTKWKATLYPGQGTVYYLGNE